MKNERKKGAGLFVVLIIAVALGGVTYSVLALVQGEFLRNKQSASFHEAKNAAESVIQQSLADLKERFDRQTSFPIDALSPKRNPLHLTKEFLDLHIADGSESSLVIPKKTKYTSLDDLGTQPTEVIGGQVPPGNWRFIDPRVPGNRFDELAGTRVFERSVEVLARATVNHPSLGSKTAHVSQTLQVRDAPLFAYAIFYHLPMEIAPGPPMNVRGNVHVNNDAWVQSGGQLNFHSKLTIAGDLHAGRHPESGKRGPGGRVRIKDASGNLVNMKEDDSWPKSSADIFGGGWLESDRSNFYSLSSQIWEGNLQTADHGVLPQTPTGVENYVEDTDPSTRRKESLNSSYGIIQPVLDADELAIPDRTVDPDGYEKAVALNAIEKQKYAYKAGLTIKVDDDGDVSYHTYERDADGGLIYDASGEPKTIELNPFLSVAEGKKFEEDDGIEQGMHDKREARDLHILEVDVHELRALVHTNHEWFWGSGSDRRPENWWNGIVYVEFPQQNATSTREDHVNPAIKGWGVKVRNGETIPNPSFAHKDDNYGMSLATNQIMYIEGNYNADGNMGTGSPTEPDDSGSFGDPYAEAPAALIADSITFLSENWDDAKSAEHIRDRDAVDTEVSAAILTGLVPSGERGYNSYSGGVENFPRFLEDWGGEELRIRGSMVALFESEVGTGAWSYGSVYKAPRRNWGFHEKFAEGFLPPGTPNTRRYRAVDFKVIDENEYQNHVAELKKRF